MASGRVSVVPVFAGVLTVTVWLCVAERPLVVPLKLC
jgi:hypothetical protein